MKYNFILLMTLFLGTLALAGAGCTTNNQSNNSTNKSAQTMEKEEIKTEQTMMDKEKTSDTETAGMMEEKNKMTENEAMMEKSVAGIYTDYSASALSEATKNGGKAVLFFWAAWCPNCKAANADFLAHTDQIPNKVTILKVNYDTEKALKTKYGITYQHTFVQVDSQGNQITKWSGGGIADLLANLK